MFGVPQFIDVEDKIAGPLTWKQLGWMIGMGAIILLVFALFDTTLAIIITIPVVLMFCALAFYKPNGTPLTFFIVDATMFLLRPKIAVWERPTGVLPTIKSENVPKVRPDEQVPEKRLTRERLAELARIIDRERR